MGVEKQKEQKSPKAHGRSPSEAPRRPQLVPSCALAPPCPQRRPSVHQALFEVASEGLALVALDLTVLDGPALQEVVHLCGVDGSCPLLILG